MEYLPLQAIADRASKHREHGGGLNDE